MLASLLFCRFQLKCQKLDLSTKMHRQSVTPFAISLSRKVVQRHLRTRHLNVSLKISSRKFNLSNEDEHQHQEEYL